MKYIVIEGADGSGKSALCESLISGNWLGEGHEVRLIREPGNGFFGTQVRYARGCKKRLLEYSTLDRQETMSRIYWARYYSDVTGLKFLISDRSYLSMAAYQSESVSEARAIAKEQMDMFGAPDVLLYLCPPPMVCISRIEARGEDPPSIAELEALQRRYEAAIEVICKESDNMIGLSCDGKLPLASVCRDLVRRIT